MSDVLAGQWDSLPQIPVKSSNVDAIAYAQDFERLFVKFKNGTVYAYENVPVDIYRAFLVAPSKGQYVYYLLRGKGADGPYPYKRIR